MLNIDFTPWKILLYPKQMEQINSGKLPSPVMLEIDPCNFCNFDCSFCTSAFLLKKVKDRKIITPKQFKHILDFIEEIGTVEGIYWCGGGEPTLNKNLPFFLRQASDRGLKNYITTNGSNMTIYAELVELCDWIAVSVNSGSECVWRKIMHPPIEYDKLLSGLRKMCDYRKTIGKRMEINYKFVFDPFSYIDIYKAYGLAIELGFTHYTVKPADMFNYDRGKNRTPFFDVWRSDIIESVNFQIAAIEAIDKVSDEIVLTTGGFYGMFDVDRERFLHFDKCWTSQMAPIFGADGNIYLCCTRRGERSVGRWDTGKLIKYWGSEEHKHKAMDFDHTSECPVRCKMGRYNEIFQTIFVDKNYSRGHV